MNDNYILAFDSIFSTNTMQMLKLVMPLIPGKYQPLVALFIKLQEFQYTYQYVLNHPTATYLTESESNFENKLMNTLHEVKPYCPAEYVGYIEQFESVIELLQKYKELEPVLQMMKDSKNQSPIDLFFGNGQSEQIQQYEDLINDLF